VRLLAFIRLISSHAAAELQRNPRSPKWGPVINDAKIKLDS
jgi:hypothetical protein